MKNKNHTSRLTIIAGFCLTLLACGHPTTTTTTLGKWTENKQILGAHRQMTFDGTRAGEGYFSADGNWMTFQSERESSNPFYQIYIQDLQSKNTWRVSTGTGKTTCSWIAPDKKRVIFSSTHADPETMKKQKEEIDFRASGQTKRYSWDYDPAYDIYEADTTGKNLRNLTKTVGYDAEASISPDGKTIVFASNRAAYEGTLTPEDQEKLKLDPSYFMDIFVMDRSGKNIRQLTQSLGYDGGPFFSPDGQRIVWRRFSPDGHTAEVFTMKMDGSDQKRITQLGAMSWAPFYHPSGDYIVFTSNILGYHNFELFIVDAQGTHSPVRVSHLDGFDGLPVFTPDGKSLTWNRKISATESQIVSAPWDDALARQALDLGPRAPQLRDLSPEMNETDLRTLVTYLSSRELAGRGTGTAGEEKMVTMTQSMFQDMGLQPAINGSYVQEFPFFKHARLGVRNELHLLNKTQRTLEVSTDWRPLAFSKRGEVAAAPVVFAGYGIRAPNQDKKLAYDSYEGLNVKDKWVLVFRYSPEDISKEQKLYLQRYARLEYKAILARDLGARGLIIVSGPQSKAKDELVPFRQASATDLEISAVSISDKLATEMFKENQQDLTKIQKNLDKGDAVAGFELNNIRLSANIEIHIDKDNGHNIIGVLRAYPPTRETVVIGAHGDHLGDNPSDSSLRNSHDKETIHFGADDNASGVSAVIRTAYLLSQQHKVGTFKPKRNIAFAIWSGEELGNLGSTYFLKNLKKYNLQPVSYVNMDMIGRWEKEETTSTLKPLAIQGIGSSKDWKKTIEKLNLNYPLQVQDDPYLPTDVLAFYSNKIPVINFFTGSHIDYHTPRDTAEKLNYKGILTVADTVKNLGVMLATSDSPVYSEVQKTGSTMRRTFRIFLGTLPDYTSEGNIKGVKINGVITGGPAEKAGLKGGDIIVEFSKQKINNLHDYMFSLETLRPNEPTSIVVLRGGERRELSIVPEAKE